MKRKILLTTILALAMTAAAGMTAMAGKYEKFIAIPGKQHVYCYSEKDGKYYEQCDANIGGVMVQAPHAVDRFGEHGLLYMGIPNGSVHDDGCVTNEECVVYVDGKAVSKTPEELGADIDLPSWIIIDEWHNYALDKVDHQYYKVCNFFDQRALQIEATKTVDRFNWEHTYYDEHGFPLYIFPDGASTFRRGDGCVIDRSGLVLDGNGKRIVKTPDELGYSTHKPEVAEVPYDPHYPLKRLIDKHDLRLWVWPQDKNVIEGNARNIISRLTGQKDAYSDEIARINKYYDEHPAEEASRAGQLAEAQKVKDDEDAIVEALRAWLNSWDVEHATEKERYDKLVEFHKDWTYDTNLMDTFLVSHEGITSAGQAVPTVINETGHNGYYISIVEKRGVCGDFANSCSLLAHLLGLRVARQWGLRHAIVLIKADGHIYGADNGLFYGPDYDYTKRYGGADYGIPSFE